MTPLPVPEKHQSAVLHLCQEGAGPDHLNKEVHKRWQVPETLKINIFGEHILEFFNDTRETMNTTNDQGPEAKSTMKSDTQRRIMVW